MKYWQKVENQKATRRNVPHLYMYTWIRASLLVAFCFNSILMFFVVKGKGVFEQTPVREEVIYIVYIILGLLHFSDCFSPRQCDRTLDRVIVDMVVWGLFSLSHVSDYSKIIFLYIVEIIFIVYYAIKIDKDNDIVDKNRFVIWWKEKKRERERKWFEKYVEKIRKRSKQIPATKKEKKKHLSRRERKRNNVKREGR